MISETFIITLPAMANVGGLLMLFLYIYSILGVFLFAEVKFTGSVFEHCNFTNIGVAFLTLIRVSTGENWHEIMYSLSKQPSITYECISSPTYQDYVANGKEPVGCGNSSLAMFFFFSFVTVVSLIFLNLFIAIILQAFDDTNTDNKNVFNKELMDHFRNVWAELDPDATSFIPKADLPQFLMQLGPPLGFDESYLENPEKREEFVEQFNLKET